MQHPNSQDSDTELHNDEPDLTLVNVPAHRLCKPRRSLGDVRNDFIKQGALLLEFELLPNTTDVAAGDVVSAWRHIERFGFLVMADTGCMIPHAQFRPHYGNSKLKLAHICSVAFFRGTRINYKAEEGKKNSFGWPVDLQVSHLCHTSGCCNPQHLVVEERWKNVKRNFCGWKVDAETGEPVCNCGMEPACIRRYAPSTAQSARPLLKYDEEKLGKKIRHFVGARKPTAAATTAADDAADEELSRRDDPTAVHPCSVRVLPADYYVVQDRKASNKLLRRDREKKHNEQTARNKARKAASEAKKNIAKRESSL